MRAAKNKSEFTQLLHKVFEPQYEEPNVQMKVIDGTAFVNIYRLRISKTFREYCNDELVKVVYSFSEGVDRMNFAFDWYFRRRTVKEEKEECAFSKENRQGVDIIDFIFDRYLENSIKTQTRGGSGEGMLISVRKDIPSCEDFKTFMRDSHNKAELFFMMAASVNQIRNVPTSVIATVYEKMLSNCFDIDFEKIMPCNHKKADTRLILHVFDACRKSYKKLTTACSDTDIAVIALYHFYDLDVNELWIEYCVGQHKR